MSEHAVQYTEFETGRRMRVTYEQRPLGAWTRRVEDRHRGEWRTVGTETVTEVELECSEGTTKIGP